MGVENGGEAYRLRAGVDRSWCSLLDMGAGSKGEGGKSWVSGLDKWLILKPST